MERYEFLYPISRSFPFDEVCENIVRALEKRGWNIPGLEIGFSTYGSGKKKFRMVNKITGPDFKIWFCRKQQNLGPYNDIAAAHQITIPGMDLSVFDDESGPTFHLYAGNNWDHDRDLFMNGSKVNSKLYKEPRIYLKYKGSFSSDPAHWFSYTGRRNPYLTNDNDCRREHDADPKRKLDKIFLSLPGDTAKHLPKKEPMFLKADDVFEIMKDFLENKLKEIMTAPETGVDEHFFDIPDITIDLTPLSGLKMFALGDGSDGMRIMRGEANLLENMFSLHGGSRFLNLGIRDDGSFPKIAYEGFTWCLPSSSIDERLVCKLQRLDYSSSNRYIIEIIPKTANGIYVADLEAMEKTRNALAENSPEKARFTDTEVNAIDVSGARTIVPWTEYKGDFIDPVILIERELGIDEAKIVAEFDLSDRTWKYQIQTL